MYYLKTLQKLWKDGADGLVNMKGSEASTDNHKHRLKCVESAETESGSFIAVEKLVADRRSGKDSLAVRNELDCLREVTAYFYSMFLAKSVGESGRHIGLMRNNRDVHFVGCHNYRNSDKTTFGKYDVRPNLPDKLLGLRKSLDNPERIGKILNIKISS